MQASPPDLVLFNQGYVEAEIVRVESGGVATRPPSKDYDIVHPVENS